ncbi:uncharacterized protein [Atheta coriaria]|uniref:uncharacterized protein isoform X2 n=1 Tax=Dalotia coriaria TaxID=877792 RepID=UPI0031F37282
MSISLLLLLIVMSVLGEETTTTQITTTTTQVTTVPEDHDPELQTEETRVLKKPENSTLPVNHSETLRAMPTEQTKTQSQQVVKISPESVLNITAVTDVGKLKDFRPSPQLETIYEYNRFPVVPAHPEAKTFGTSIKIPIHSTLSHVLDNEEEEPEKDVWTSKVRFPHTHPVTVNDHPYPYLKDGIDKGSATAYGGYGHSGQGHQKDLGLVKRPIMHKHSYGGEGGWDKTLKRKPPSKTYHEDGGYHTDLSSSPWKKIIKILTAFIPIGLLLSALTPSIITIGPMNGTARSGEKAKNSLLSQLALDGCDERIFCELMLNAEESGNNDKNIETMLQNYLESHGDTTRLQLIYKAIKSGNCSSLRCNSIKE